MNLQKAPNSTHKTKRIGRGQGSGMGKTATKGGKGQTARKGYNEKRGFEGGQQPLQRRLPKVGFTSKFEKPYVINVEKVKAVAELKEISFESIKSVHKFAKSVCKIKLVGKGAKELASKIKDENISTSGISSKKASVAKVAPKSVAKAAPKADAKAAEIQSEKKAEPKAEKSVQAPKAEKSVQAPKAEKTSAPKKVSSAEKVATNSAKKASAAKKKKKNE